MRNAQLGHQNASDNTATTASTCHNPSLASSSESNTTCAVSKIATGVISVFLETKWSERKEGKPRAQRNFGQRGLMRFKPGQTERRGILEDTEINR